MLPDRQTEARISEEEKEDEGVEGKDEEEEEASSALAGSNSSPSMTYQTLVLVRVHHATQKHEGGIEVLQPESHQQVEQYYH